MMKTRDAGWGRWWRCCCWWAAALTAAMVAAGYVEAAQCTEGEAAELLALKGGVSSDPGGALASWSSGTNCCEWAGVTCDGAAQAGAAAVVAVDISGQSLGGGLAEGFGSSGALSSLRQLVLSSNDFGGAIPDSISDLVTLQRLWMDGNQLSGIIPGVMVKLQALTEFNVSSNELAGEIPQAIPFTAFPVSSYADNAGLCGTPLPTCVGLN